MKRLFRLLTIPCWLCGSTEGCDNLVYNNLVVDCHLR
jgi:hypothetical protein